MITAAACIAETASYGDPRRLISTETQGRGGIYAYFVCRGRIDGTCDLPHLPIATVERAVENHIATLQPDPDLAQAVRASIDEQRQNHRDLAEAMRAGLKKELVAIDEREERLVFAIADASMPTDRVKKRINRLRQRRHSVQQRLSQAEGTFTPELDAPRRLLDSIAEIYDLYQIARDEIRQSLSQALVNRIPIEETGSVVVDEPTKTIQGARQVIEVHHNARSGRLPQESTADDCFHSSANAFSDVLARVPVRTFWWS